MKNCMCSYCTQAKCSQLIRPHHSGQTNICGRALCSSPPSTGTNWLLRHAKGLLGQGMTTCILHQHNICSPDKETSDDKSKWITTMNDRLQTRLIRAVWMGMMFLWSLRNEEQQWRDKEKQERACHEVLTNKLQVFYNNRDQYPAGVKKLLWELFYDHHRDESSRIEDWLHAYHAV
jgi:trehalose-6-phosphate synthase